MLHIGYVTNIVAAVTLELSFIATLIAVVKLGLYSITEANVNSGYIQK